VARQPDTLGSHPAFQCGNQRLDPFLSDSMPLLTPGTVPTPEREVRIRLPAGASGIRTIGPRKRESFWELP